MWTGFARRLCPVAEDGSCECQLPGGDEQPPVFDAVGSVDAEYVDRRSADWGLAHERRPPPREMVGPAVGPRVEERDEFVRLGVVARGVTAFEAIALCAGPTGVFQRAGAAVLAGAYMVHLVRQRRTVLGELTVLAAVARAV